MLLDQPDAICIQVQYVPVAEPTPPVGITLALMGPIHHAVSLIIISILSLDVAPLVEVEALHIIGPILVEAIGQALVLVILKAAL